MLFGALTPRRESRLTVRWGALWCGGFYYAARARERPADVIRDCTSHATNIGRRIPQPPHSGRVFFFILMASMRNSPWVGLQLPAVCRRNGNLSSFLDSHFDFGLCFRRASRLFCLRCPLP